MLTKEMMEEELPPLKNDLGLEANRAASRFRGELANLDLAARTKDPVAKISAPNFSYIPEQECSRARTADQDTGSWAQQKSEQIKSKSSQPGQSKIKLDYYRHRRSSQVHERPHRPREHSRRRRWERTEPHQNSRPSATAIPMVLIFQVPRAGSAGNQYQSRGIGQPHSKDTLNEITNRGKQDQDPSYEQEKNGRNHKPL